jgi:aminopeptidase N
MDEGFTEFATDRTQAFLESSKTFAHQDNYNNYLTLAKSSREEPMTTHADHFNSNFAYSLAAYSKGCVFLSQLGYITGEENLKKILLEYYRLWRFKHPNVNDFIRVAEKVSDMKLDWYQEYWVNTTKTIDYGIDSLWEENKKTKIRLRRIGQMPMPVDFQLTFKDGSKELHYVPMSLVFGQKPEEDSTIKRFVYEPWKWTHRTYIIETNHRLTDIQIAEIDPSLRLADIERKNNKIELKF